GSGLLPVDIGKVGLTVVASERDSNVVGVLWKLNGGKCAVRSRQACCNLVTCDLAEDVRRSTSNGDTGSAVEGCDGDGPLISRHGHRGVRVTDHLNRLMGTFNVVSMGDSDGVVSAR